MGLFIVIEGLDGAGSSTQVVKLANYLKQRGYKVITTKEPTNNIIGGLIKGQLTHDWNTSPECLQLLFAADRAHHLEKTISPALEDNYIVISDRYIFSTIAFGAININDWNWLKEINKQFRFPDLYFIIDTDPEECIKRLKKTRYKLELFEDIEKLKKVHKNFLKLVEEYKPKHNIHIINGNQLVEDVFDDIKAIIKPKLNSLEPLL